ncbi:MAG: hypothetical protein WCJ92_02735 [Alphaproteobacteria bacterium]
MLKKFLNASFVSLFILNFFGTVYAMEGPVHHPDYYAGIIHSILANRDLTEYHQKNAEDALAYLENTEVSPNIRARLIEQILLEKDLKKFHLQAASAGVVLLSEGLLPIKEKASIALHLFTNKSLKKYYQHEVAIRAWEEFSFDESVHSSISLAKEVIACNILRRDKFQEHHEHAILIWKSLDILTQGFMVCDILQNDSLARHHKYAQRFLKKFFFTANEVVPKYTKKRLAEIIKSTRSKQLVNCRSIASDYLDSLLELDSPATTEETQSAFSSSKKRKRPAK